jgi:hypothetical protein
MGDEILSEGGPHKIRKTEDGKFEFGITVPTDEDGRYARECPDEECSPGYFKVKGGTGISGGQEKAYCPYCRKEAEPDSFTTKEQRRYTEDTVYSEAHRGLDGYLKRSLGFDSAGKRQMDGGLFKINMSIDSLKIPVVTRPTEEELQRVVICPHCGLDHAVYGLATWCPDCGQDIFMIHVHAEFMVVRSMLYDLGRRKSDLGIRVAVKDAENCLEDTVSIFEAVLKAILTRQLQENGNNAEAIQEILRKIKNGFQNPGRANEIIDNYIQVRLLTDPVLAEQLGRTFEKRHPITHNLGVVDKKYIRRSFMNEKEGQEIRVTKEEINEAIAISLDSLDKLYDVVFKKVAH